MADYTTPNHSKGDRVTITTYLEPIHGVITDIQHIRGNWLYFVRHGGEVHQYGEKELE